MIVRRGILFATVSMATILCIHSADKEKHGNGSVFRMKRSPRKGLPFFPVPTTLSPTTMPITTATTPDPGPSERDIAEMKILELFMVVDEVLGPNALKTEEDKLTMVRAVENYLKATLSGIEDDQWIVLQRKTSAVKIRLLDYVTNTTELQVDFAENGDSVATPSPQPTEVSNATQSTIPPAERGIVNMIRVPEDVVSDLVGKNVIFAVVYYFGDIFTESSELEECPDRNAESDNEETVMNSGVMSCFALVDGVPTSLPVEILLQHQQTIIPRVEEDFREESTRLVTRVQTITKSQSLCTYYDYEIREWSQTGCEADRAASDGEQTLCYCNHTTNFAVLMQVKEFSISETHVKALNIITVIGCSISLFALVVTVVLFIWLETLKSDHNIIHFNLILALLIAQTIFLSGVSATSNKIACMTVAILLHISFLAVFTWMLMEGVHLYSKVVIVFGTEGSKIKCYILIGWGVPLAIVAIAAAINPGGYGTPTGCWLDMKSGQVWAFVAPAIIVLLVNVIVLIMVLRIVVVSTKTASEKKKDNSYVKTAVKSSLFLLPILGVTWLFGLFAVDDNSVVFQYMFAVANSLQGLFVFLFQGVFNTEVRTAFKRKMEKRALEKGDIVTTSAASHSRTYDRTGLSAEAKTRMTSTSCSTDHQPYRNKSVHSTLSNGDIIIEEESEIYSIEEPTLTNRAGYTQHHNSSSSRSPTPISIQSILPGATVDNQREMVLNDW